MPGKAIVNITLAAVLSWAQMRAQRMCVAVILAIAARVYYLARWYCRRIPRAVVCAGVTRLVCGLQKRVRTVSENDGNNYLLRLTDGECIAMMARDVDSVATKNGVSGNIAVCYCR